MKQIFLQAKRQSVPPRSAGLRVVGGRNVRGRQKKLAALHCGAPCCLLFFLLFGSRSCRYQLTSVLGPWEFFRLQSWKQGIYLEMRIKQLKLGERITQSLEFHILHIMCKVHLLLSSFFWWRCPKMHWWGENSRHEKMALFCYYR